MIFYFFNSFYQIIKFCFPVTIQSQIGSIDQQQKSTESKYLDHETRITVQETKFNYLVETVEEVKDQNSAIYKLLLENIGKNNE